MEPNNDNQGKSIPPGAQGGGNRRSFRPPAGLILLLCVLPACSVSGDAVTSIPLAPPAVSAGACSNVYFPVAPGALWNYHVTGSPTGDYDYFSIVNGVNASAFTVDNHFGDLVTSTPWQCDTTGLAALSPGGSATIETPNAEFVYTVTGSEGDTLPAGIETGDTWTQTLSLHGEHTTSGGSVFTSDGTYTSHYTAAGFEDIKTAAGAFTAMRVDIESNWNLKTTISGVTVPIHLNITSSVWYAPGVGMVKNVTVFEGSTTTVELTGYSLP